MNRQKGFSLIELIVSLSIVGVLAATAVPVYNTWQQRAYGQEATLMAKRILDGQIIYYLENNCFYPEDTTSQLFIIPDTDPTITQQNIEDVLRELKVSIPSGHGLTYQFDSYSLNDGKYFQIMIDAGFPLFKGGDNRLVGTVDSSGKIVIYSTFVGG